MVTRHTFAWDNPSFFVYRCTVEKKLQICEANARSEEVGYRKENLSENAMLLLNTGHCQGRVRAQTASSSSATKLPYDGGKPLVVDVQETENA